jgi:peptidoglycan-associated lipoprotein
VNKMKRKSAVIAILLLAGVATAADAQFRLPVIIPLGRSKAPPPAAAQPIAVPGMSQGSLVAAAGTDTVYFSANGTSVDATAAATLAAEARWLLANPAVTIRLEGHGGPNDSRDYALAIGDRRANAVRDFLVSQGVPPQRISVLSWGKERPGHVLIGQSLVAAGPRVVTMVMPPPPLLPQAPVAPGR